jgi:hypothetical protein
MQRTFRAKGTLDEKKIKIFFFLREIIFPLWSKWAKIIFHQSMTIHTPI